MNNTFLFEKILLVEWSVESYRNGFYKLSFYKIIGFLNWQLVFIVKKFTFPDSFSYVWSKNISLFGKHRHN